MALERKDLRLKLDADVHSALQVLADVDKLNLCELAEQVLAEYVGRRIHDATVVAEKTARLGISGNGGESTPARALKGVA
jgi:hypothetical protein